MTGLIRRSGGSTRLVRTGIELGVVAIGWPLGLATVLYALAIRPMVQLFLSAFSVPRTRRDPTR